MTVYVVTIGHVTQSQVYKVFDTEEKAKEFCKSQTFIKTSYKKFEVE